MTSAAPAQAATLGVLTQGRVLDLGRVFGVRRRSTSATSAQLAEAMSDQLGERLPAYDFTHGSSLLEPLWIGMRDRGVDVRFFIHIDQVSEAPSDSTAYGNDAATAVMTYAWLFGEPRPRVYHDARVLVPRPRFNMHATCVVVDGERALITSETFTRRAQEQNTECGFSSMPRPSRTSSRQCLGLAEAGLAIEWSARL